MKSKIVLGLGFGDEGKGITTDYLCSKDPKESKIVIRFSGGQQAGHTVIVDGVKHIHSSFGSGSLRGVPTYISEHCTVYPVSLVSEYFVLKSKCFNPKIYFHPLAKITTPMDVFINRKKSVNKDTCGLGIGTTMTRNAELYTLRIMDLLHPDLFKEKYRVIKNNYYYGEDFSSEEYQKIEKYFFDNIRFITRDKIKDYSILTEFDQNIYEGSQGILLDQDYGLFPNVTYSKTTLKNAVEIIQNLYFDDYLIDCSDIYFVTRCYQTRHGFGWMSNNDKIELVNNNEEINVYNQYQGDFRIGELDYDLINYAIEANRQDMKEFFGFTNNLVVTCLDQRPSFIFDYDKINYNFFDILNSHGSDSKFFVYL